MTPDKNNSIATLDKGFVRLIDFIGGDAGVVDAARVSYGGSAKGEAQDRKLIAFLIKHDHMTPFEHAVFKFHIKCPIFVARQWFRHRMASYNEISYRYTEIKDEFYFPAQWRAQDNKNKQGSLPASEIDQEEMTKIYATEIANATAAYKKMVKAGVAREMARMVLPVGIYTEFYWTVNARSLTHFIALRADSHAQWEIQQSATALAVFFEGKMPWTWAAFIEHSWKGKNPLLNKQREALATQAS